RTTRSRLGVLLVLCNAPALPRGHQKNLSCTGTVRHILLLFFSSSVRSKPFNHLGHFYCGNRSIPPFVACFGTSTLDCLLDSISGDDSECDWDPCFKRSCSYAF